MLDDLGGLGDIIKSGDRVAIKINLTGGDWAAKTFQNQTGLTAGESIWTHPDILRAIGELILDAGAGKLIVVEGIYDWESVNDHGYAEVISGLGADFIDLNQTAPYGDYVVRPVGDQALIYENLTQNAVLNEIDCFISLAKSKRHDDAGVTHGMKNLVGTLPIPPGIYNDGQGHRAAIHQHTSYDGNMDSNLCRVIMDINMAAPVHLVVNDAVMTVLGGEGPWLSITPARFDTLVVSKDPVAADSIATQAMDFDPMADAGRIPFPTSINCLLLAQQLGLGNADPAQIDIIDTDTTAVNHPVGRDLPNRPELSCYPNPFNGQTVIEWTGEFSGPGVVTVHDARGRIVRRMNIPDLNRGARRVIWNGRDDRGAALSSGRYIVRMRAGRNWLTRPVIFCK
jgi:uncharacterized protein (DUF362 family)